MKKILLKIKNRIAKRFSTRQFLLEMMPRNSICIEIGAWKGDFSSQILKINKPKKLYVIDPYKYVKIYEDSWYGGDNMNQQKMDAVYEGIAIRFKRQIRKGILEIIRDDSSTAYKKLKDSSIDWIYIDGNHLYENVRQDLLYFLPKIKIGGYITGDDYGIEGWWKDGVKKAVDEFILEYNQFIEVVKIESNQFILKKLAEIS